MAKRRKLEAPSADDLSRIEDEFRRETGPRPAAAPIAQVAAETARSLDLASPADRADKAAAEAYRAAKEQGLVMAEIPVTEIDPEDLIRDRAELDQEEMTELRMSIAANGLRLPIEVYELAQPREGMRFGVLSGYRRLLAVRALLALTEDKKYQTIRAIIRKPETVSGAFVAMVEENEIRANLSQFERGRIAAITAQTGAFASVEEAVNTLFAQASRAKRSKVRSFAQIFEDLGDLLVYPDALTERSGLRLAAALRSGAERELRDALAAVRPMSADEEWALLEPVIRASEAQPKSGRRAGRPRTRGSVASPTRTLSNGIRLSRSREGSTHYIRLDGPHLDEELMESLMAEIERLLEIP